MKQNQGLFILIFWLLTRASFAQCPQCTTRVVTDPNLPPGNYYARDEVDIKSGAGIHPTSGQQMHLYTDKTIQLPSTNQPSVNYGSSQVDLPINFSLPVGKTQGQGGVTPTGQATYDIPIFVPPGTNGMVPTLGLSYNSGSPDGLVGRGWSIRGLSVITRVTKDVYHDGKFGISHLLYKQGINFSSDAYILDGVRLISTSTPNEYRLENDNFTRITFSSSGNYFIVETKSGLKMEYGNPATSSQSRFMLSPGNVAIAWYLDKVTDNHGNYMRYDYLNPSGKEVSLKEINYTGTTNGQPYNSIKFYYDTRADQNTLYLKNNVSQNSVILREIEITCEQKYTKGYQFKYGFNSQPFLNEIIEIGSDYSKLNSTYIKYGDNVTSANTIDVVTPKKSVSNADLIANADYMVGDFNGDGKSDLIAFIYNTIYATGKRDYSGGQWRLYINEDDGTHFKEIVPTTALPAQFFPYTFNDYSPEGFQVPIRRLASYGPRSSLSTTNSRSKTNDEGSAFTTSAPAELMVCDFNRDGKDDILINNTASGKSTFKVYYSTGNDFTHTTTNSDYPYHPFTMSSSNSQFVLADIDGDGIPEAIEYNSGSVTTPWFNVWWFATGECTEIEIPAGVTKIYQGFSAIDFDGDGIHELLTKFNNTLVVLKLSFFSKSTPCFYMTSQYQKAVEVYSEIVSQSPYVQNYYGDYNGDGITDNMKVSIATTRRIGYVKIRYGTGTTFTNLTDLPGISLSNYFNRKFLNMDINDDGKFDLVLINNNGSRDVCGGATALEFQAWYGNLSHSGVQIGCVGSLGFPDCIDYNFEPGNYPSDYNNVPEFTVGDFDGDGRQDVFLKTNNNGQRAIAFINQGSTQHLVTTISDGFRDKTNFTYKTLANGGVTVYEKGSATRTYPILDINSPLYVVSASSISDGIGGINSMAYKYEGGTAHLEGKGFLGFDKCTITDNTSNTKIENNFYLDPNPATSYFEKIPSQTKTFLLPDVTNPISEEAYSSTFVQTTGKAHYVTTDNVTSMEHISGKTIIKTLTYDNNNNLIQTVTNLNGIETTTVNSPYESAGSWSNSIKNVPDYVVTTTTRSGDTYSRRVNYDYDGANGDLLIITHDPSTSNEITTTNTYYTTGVCSTKFVHATTCSTCVDKRISYDYDNNNDRFRFIVKETNHFPSGDQISEAQYDPKWGLPIWKKGVDGLTTSYVYDAFGKNVKTMTPDNLTASAKFEWVQPGTMPTSDLLNVNNYGVYSISNSRLGSPDNKVYYDLKGRELETENDGFSGKTYAQKVYNTKGNLVADTEPYFSNYTTTPPINYYTYDDLNRLEYKTLYFGSPYPIHYEYFLGNGNEKIKTTTPDSKSSYETTDPSGKLIEAQDDGGTLYYSYFANGQIMDIRLNSKTNPPIASMTYDPFGFQQTLSDKDAGLINYLYDAFGQLIYQEDAIHNKVDQIDYDGLGRMTQKTVHNTTESYSYTYNYVPYGSNGVNQIQQKQVTGTNGTFKSVYSYDGLNRLTSYKEEMPGQTFVTSYQYDLYSRISKINYPGGFSITNQYDNNNKGYLLKMKNGQTGDMIWLADEKNQLGQYSKYTLGNGVQTQVSYNGLGLPEDINAGSIQHLKMDFNLTNGNLNWRKDITPGRNLTETFSYSADNLNRLTDVNGPSPLTIGYNTDGTIAGKLDAGSYADYTAQHPDAVWHIGSPASTISHTTQDIAYTPFNKMQRVIELPETLNVNYGPDQQRAKTEIIQSGTTIETKYFHSNYEKLIIAGHTYEINYLSAPTGLCAMFVTDNGGVGKLYYVYTDQLGSILTLVDDQGNKIEQNFDAWGRYREPDNWNYTSGNRPAGLPDWLSRGFTGHEHLSDFALINMNGRCYDPVLGMMLSADNEVPDATSTLGFNRYSYALNNPLAYVDQDGNNPLIIIGIMAVAGGYLGGKAANQNNPNPFKWKFNQKTWEGIGIGFGLGAAAGAGLYYGGPYVASALYNTGIFGSGTYSGLAASGIGYGITGGLTLGAAGYGTGYLTDRYVNGASSSEAEKTGWSYAWQGAKIGFVIGFGYGLTPGAYKNAYFPDNSAFSCDAPGVASYQEATTFNFPEIFGKGLKTSSEWVDRTYWTSSNSVTTAILGGTQIFLPGPPPWLGDPNYEGPYITPKISTPDSWFNWDGSLAKKDIFRNISFPYGGWVNWPNSAGPFNYSLWYKHRIYSQKRVWKLFGLSLWRVR